MNVTLRAQHGKRNGGTHLIECEGKVIGHVGPMAGGTMAFVNLAKSHGFTFKSHNGEARAAVTEALNAAPHLGLVLDA